MMTDHKHHFSGPEGHCVGCGVSLAEYAASIRERVERLKKELAQRKELALPEDDPMVIDAIEKRLELMERAMTELGYANI